MRPAVFGFDGLAFSENYTGARGVGRGPGDETRGSVGFGAHACDPNLQSGEVYSCVCVRANGFVTKRRDLVTRREAGVTSREAVAARLVL